MPLLTKKIGMNLGIEYLVRSGLIKKFMELPCSIFVKSSSTKVVITINTANTGKKYCVRNWCISSCREDQPIPSMLEYIVGDSDLHHDSSVVLTGFTPLYFDCNSVEWKRNRGNNGHPMPDYVYEDYFHKMLSPLSHHIKKETFLWDSFVNTYLPSIEYMIDEEVPHHWGRSSSSRGLIHTRQQRLVEKNFKGVWRAWLKWKKFMLFDTVPGELIFMKDYN